MLGAGARESCGVFHRGASHRRYLYREGRSLPDAEREQHSHNTHTQVGWLSILAEVEDGAAPPKPPAATLAADFRSLGTPERSPDLVDGIGDDLRLAFRAALRALRRARSYYVLWRGGAVLHFGEYREPADLCAYCVSVVLSQ